mmetsp:Transcript_2029/g.7838  ORF Transcript_2029/g.7838 Transcript_2029/m.7838 type:complete len:225 (+) Transcript_2029:1730-2404(+)
MCRRSYPRRRSYSQRFGTLHFRLHRRRLKVQSFNRLPLHSFFKQLELRKPRPRPKRHRRVVSEHLVQTPTDLNRVDLTLTRGSAPPGKRFEQIAMAHGSDELGDDAARVFAFQKQRSPLQESSRADIARHLLDASRHLDAILFELTSGFPPAVECPEHFAMLQRPDVLTSCRQLLCPVQRPNRHATPFNESRGKCSPLHALECAAHNQPLPAQGSSRKRPSVER